MDIYGTRAYYKGTSLHCPSDDDTKFLQMIIKTGHKQIEVFLRNGEGIAKTIAYLTEQLDCLEEGLCEAQKKTGPWGVMSKTEYMKYLSDASFGSLKGEEFIARWWINIASLLELKAIKNDEMNGWLIMKQK